MALFGKNEDYEDDEEFDELDRREDRKLTKRFQDLNYGNKKRRKEPAKPWGKKRG